MKKILVTGDGQFTTNWIKNTTELYKNSVVSRSERKRFSENYYSQDLSNYLQTKELITFLKPDVILNGAGLIDIEKCEKYPEIAIRSNVEIPKNLSQIAAHLGVPLIHISTDHFESKKGVARDEQVIPQPVNHYGITKIQGENEIIKSSSNFIILRTNFYGVSGNNKSSFFSKLLKDILNEKPYLGASDYYFNPVSIKFLINCIIEFIHLGSTGTYNITSDNCISKYEFAKLVCKSLYLDENLIKKVELKYFHELTKRPQKLCLDNKKLKNLFKIQEVSVFKQVKSLIKELELSKKP